MLFEITKNVHLVAISFSITGFILRSYFLVRNKTPDWFTKLPVKLPHYIDVVLLSSAIVMVMLWHVNPFVVPWLAEKLTALCLYVFLGMVALHWAKSTWTKAAAGLLAIGCFFYIVQVAITKQTILF